ncbi:helicase C-terminal domain-containing protein [Bacillus sp. FJAT-27251]|uniref:helicase C-terminal domain-containing protein n=1 Tax=Bacillus sp. FJAT-27251 TaxID=1684142 RepID=UPI00336A3662
MEYKISVRALVEYAYRSGSIETQFMAVTSMTEGTRAHQEVQKNYHDQDGSEVYLQTNLQIGELVLKVDGRADGILFRDGHIIIDEIKSTSGNLALIDATTFPVHWAQAEIYAYMYAKENNLEEMTVQLTYMQIDTREVIRFAKRVSFKELEAAALHAAHLFAPYANSRLKHMEKRDTSIQAASFPFKGYRAGQKKLAGAVYKTILDKNTLFASAPTGIGKTISTLFPAIKSIGEGLAGKIFFLTAKTITRQAAEQALKRLETNGLHFQCVTLTAKDKICFKDETICTKEHCEFASGYYDRINGAVLDILSCEGIMDRDTIEQYAVRHRVCPFEFSLDLAYVSDAVICDYNYVFDRRKGLRRFTDNHRKRTVLLVDEAHNLVDRGREMYSSVLNKAPFLEIRRRYKNKNEDLYAQAKAFNEFFIQLRKQYGRKGPFILEELPENLDAITQNFVRAAEEELALSRDSRGLLLETYFCVQDWLQLGKLADDRFIIHGEANKGDVYLKLFCLDPSRHLQHAGKAYLAKVFFSATLEPFDYFKEMLGSEKGDYLLRLPSPFAPEQSDVYIQPLSTRFPDREKSVIPIVRTIESLVKSRPGNYLVFFPSYQYMNMVAEEWRTQGMQAIVQVSGMDEKAREAYLATFSSQTDAPLVGFAVLGGIFSEGIDLKGDRLKGVVIVGTGLPQLSFERNLIKHHYDSIGKNGYDYAYVFPGMCKVLQAGGRLIRGENDSGTIVLIDDRFLQGKYRRMFPLVWNDFHLLKNM